MNSRLFIGCSGYIYKHWRGGVFYPAGLSQKKWFDYYCSQFDTLEVNTTFYRLARPDAVAEWHRQSPGNFKFFVKGSRFITHMKKLNDPHPALKKFFAAIKPLKEKLAGVLWQLPPSNFKSDPARLARFIMSYAKFTDAKLVFEFREPSWFNADVFEILVGANAALCRADQPAFYREQKIPKTADFEYYRRHGPAPEDWYAGTYSEAAIERDAREIKSHLKRKREVYVYFNNDIGGHAPRDARRLQQAFSLTTLDSRTPRL